MLWSRSGLRSLANEAAVARCKESTTTHLRYDHGEREKGVGILTNRAHTHTRRNALEREGSGVFDWASLSSALVLEGVPHLGHPMNKSLGLHIQS